MVKKNTENNEHIKSQISGSIEKTPPSNDFRETLRRSGLDISAFQTEEPKNANLSGEKNSAVYSVDFAEGKNNSMENESVQSLAELSEAGKKVLPRFRHWQSLMAVAGIVAVIVLQSVFQFSFIQSENLRVTEDLTKNNLPVKQVVEKTTKAESLKAEIPEIKEEAKARTKTEIKKPDAEIAAKPKDTAPKIQREPQIVPSQTAFRKKSQRATVSKRIRRAEKLLTGF